MDPFYYFASADGELISINALDIWSMPQIVALCAWKYGWLPSWPIVWLVSKDAHCVLRLPWKWARNEPRDGISLRSARCTRCGWWTGKPDMDEPQCIECHNCVVCRECVVGGLCLCCMKVGDAPAHMRCFIMTKDECCETMGQFHRASNYFKLREERHRQFSAWARMVDQEKRRSRTGQMVPSPPDSPPRVHVQRSGD